MIQLELLLFPVKTDIKKEENEFKFIYFALKKKKKKKHSATLKISRADQLIFATHLLFICSSIFSIPLPKPNFLLEFQLFHLLFFISIPPSFTHLNSISSSYIRPEEFIIFSKQKNLS